MLNRYGIPGDVLDALKGRSSATGEPVEVVAQRLIAQVLPDTLADAPREAFRHLTIAPTKRNDLRPVPEAISESALPITPSTSYLNSAHTEPRIQRVRRPNAAPADETLA